MRPGDDADSLLRAVAAAPALAPPQRSLSVVVSPQRAGLETAARALCDDVAVIGATLCVTFREPDDAAAAALRLRASVSGARLAVVIADAVTTEVVERARALLAAVPDEIVLDRATASRLGARFELREHAAGWVLVADRTARVAAVCLDHAVDEPTLALVRGGMRFADVETEQRYRAWHRAVVTDVTRAGDITVLVGWLIAGVALWLAHPPQLGAALVGVVVFAVVVGGHLASTYVSRWRAWMIPTTVMVFPVAGSFLIAMCSWFLDLPSAGAAGTAVVTFLAFAVYRLPLISALLAVAPCIAVDQGFLVEALRAGRIQPTELIIDTMTVASVLVMAICAGIFVERGSHASYRQERIIEAQQRAIAREREHVGQLEREAAERDKRLLEAEVRRQVAERARDLSEAIARLGDAPVTRARLAPSDVVDERYRVIRPIGEGGMGQVFEVECIADGRRLALKVLSHVADRSSLARFAREAQLAAELDHPNVIAALDVGVTAEGVLYLVMQLVTGTSLDRARARYGERMWALPILCQIGDAVVAMHERGIIHRDLKPSNVLLDGERVKVTDFGIASLVAQPLGEPTPDGATALAAGPALTRAGALVGTPSYMAPELCAGTQEAGPASDAFSLGVVAYELLAGRLPHMSPPAIERLAGRVLAPPTPLGELCPELPDALAALVDRCLCEVPSDRPTMRALVAGFRG